MSRKVPYLREGHHRPRKRRKTLRATILIAAALSVIATVALVEDARVAAQAGGAAQAGDPLQAAGAAPAAESASLQSAPTILGSEITWTPEVEFENALLVVVGRSAPRSVKQLTFGARDVLRLDVSRAGLTDGRYKYELFLYPPSAGRSSAATQRVTVRSGVFLVRGGLPIAPRDLDQPRPSTPAPPRGGGRP